MYTIHNKYENKLRLSTRVRCDLSYSLTPIFAYFLLTPSTSCSKKGSNEFFFPMWKMAQLGNSCRWLLCDDVWVYQEKHTQLIWGPLLSPEGLLLACCQCCCEGTGPGRWMSDKLINLTPSGWAIIPTLHPLVLTGSDPLHQRYVLSWSLIWWVVRVVPSKPKESSYFDCISHMRLRGRTGYFCILCLIRKTHFDHSHLIAP